MTLTVTMAVFLAGYIAACFVQRWLRLRERKMRRKGAHDLWLTNERLARAGFGRNNVTRLHARGSEPRDAA